MARDRTPRIFRSQGKKERKPLLSAGVCQNLSASCGWVIFVDQPPNRSRTPIRTIAAGAVTPRFQRWRRAERAMRPMTLWRATQPGQELLRHLEADNARQATDMAVRTYAALQPRRWKASAADLSMTASWAWICAVVNWSSSPRQAWAWRHRSRAAALSSARWWQAPR